MLKIWLGDFREDCILAPNKYFDRTKEPWWFKDPWVKKVIKAIDHVDAVQDEYMISPIIGAMTPMHLSTGCKSLILMYIDPNSNVYASRCGDNCAEYIIELSEMRDVTVTLHHSMIFPRDFKGMIMDNGTTFNTRQGYLEAYIRFKYGGKK